MSSFTTHKVNSGKSTCNTNLAASELIRTVTYQVCEQYCSQDYTVQSKRECKLIGLCHWDHIIREVIYIDYVGGLNHQICLPISQHLPSIYGTVRMTIYVWYSYGMALASDPLPSAVGVVTSCGAAYSHSHWWGHLHVRHFLQLS